MALLRIDGRDMIGFFFFREKNVFDVGHCFKNCAVYTTRGDSTDHIRWPD